MAAAHILFSYGLVNSNIIEFSTLSGILTAKKVPEVKPDGVSIVHNGEAQDSYFIELDFPATPSVEFNDVSSITKALNVPSIVDIRMAVSKNFDNLLVSLSPSIIFDVLLPTLLSILIR